MIRALVWPAMPVMVNGEGSVEVLPIPALSKVMTRCLAARALTNEGCQASMEPENPMISTSGGPWPTER